MGKSLDVKDLARHIRQAKGKVTFVIGAGASKSAGIPLAATLVEMASKEFGHCLDALEGTDRTTYGRVMGQLTPAEREELITPLLHKAKLNWGSIALASMIQAKLVQRVLTFNFDLVLEHAASVLNIQMPVYDFGVAPTSDIERLVDPAIIHLHGQGHGMRLMNSHEETTEHCNLIRPLFDRVLKTTTTVVIGYSGEADPALALIENAFDSRHRLFWLGHEKEPKAHLESLLKRSFAEYVGDCDFDRVMAELAKELGVFPPPILDNPMRHVLAVLEPTTDFPIGDDTAENILTEARRRLGDFADQWETRPLEQRVLESPLRASRDAPPLDAIQVASLSPEARTVLAWHFVNQGLDLVEKAGGMTGEAAVGKWREAAAEFARAWAIQPDMHEALYNWGNALSEMSKHLPPEAAIATLREAGEKYAQALALKPDDHEALDNWAIALLMMAARSTGEDRVRALDTAQEKLTRHRDLTGKTSFNHACLHALRGETDAAVAALVACRADGLLPEPAHLDADTDLDSIRDDPAYRAFRASLDAPKDAA